MPIASIQIARDAKRTATWPLFSARCAVTIAKPDVATLASSHAPRA